MKRLPGNNTAYEAEKIVRPVLGQNFPDIEFFDLEFVKEGPNWYLRIYIDRENGVTIDDCEAVSRAVEKVLDEKDPIEHAYILEVSSPGIDRPLKKDRDFAKYRGREVEIRLYRPEDGAKTFRGKLVGLVDGGIAIECGGVEKRFGKEDVAVCRLTFENIQNKNIQNKGRF